MQPKTIINNREIINIETRIGNLRQQQAQIELSIRGNENNIANHNKEIEILKRNNDELLKSSTKISGAIEVLTNYKEQEDFLKDNNSEKKTESKEDKSSEIKEVKK